MCECATCRRSITILFQKTPVRFQKRLSAQINLHTFDSLDPISIIGFKCYFKLAGETNGTHEDAAVCAFKVLVRKQAAVALNARLASKLESQTRMTSAVETTTMTVYSQVFKHTLRTYTADENIAETTMQK